MSLDEVTPDPGDGYRDLTRDEIIRFIVEGSLLEEDKSIYRLDILRARAEDDAAMSLNRLEDEARNGGFDDGYDVAAEELESELKTEITTLKTELGVLEKENEHLVSKLEASQYPVIEQLEHKFKVIASVEPVDGSDIEAWAYQDGFLDAVRQIKEAFSEIRSK